MALRRTLPFALLLALCSASGVMLAAPAAWAHGGRPWRPPEPVVVPAVSVSLQSAHGHALTTVRHRGQTFVAGERGERYEIVVTNNTARRVEVVVSVDGRDVVSGKLADFIVIDRDYLLGDAADLPDAHELAEWFRFLATACPECGVLDDALLTGPTL